MKMTKLTRSVLAGMMTCSMALTAVATVASSGGVMVTAAEKADSVRTDDVKVELHKKAFDDDKKIVNTGDEHPDYKDLAGVANVDFEAYNVTALYRDAKASLEEKYPGTEIDPQDIADLVTEQWHVNKGDSQPVKTQTTNAAGVATFDLPRFTTYKGHDVSSIYLFEELHGDDNKGNANMTPSVPTIVGFSESLLRGKDKLILYPKNYNVTKDLLGLGDTSLPDNAVYNFEVGQKLTYRNRITIPGDILSKATMEDGTEGYYYEKFNLLDKMTTTGTDFAGVESITYMDDENEEVNVTTDFTDISNYTDSTMGTWTHGTAGYNYDIQIRNGAKTGMADLLKDIAGKTLTITYKMVINEDAKTYEDIGNDFYGVFDHKGGQITVEDDSPKIETGGRKFVKVDSQNQDVTLAGAQFALSREVKVGEETKTLYAKFTYKNDVKDDTTVVDGNYKPEKIDWVELEDGDTVEQAQAKKHISTFTSADGEHRGNLSFTGLAQQIDGKEVTYHLTETKAPNGYTPASKDTTFTIKEGAKDTQEIVSTNILNTSDDEFLPITGGTGIVAFLILGAAAMGGATYLKKRKA